MKYCCRSQYRLGFDKVNKNYEIQKGDYCMKTTGIVRRMDDMGRIAIPKALCRKLKISEFDPFEVFTEDDNKIILKKYNYEYGV